MRLLEENKELQDLRLQIATLIDKAKALPESPLSSAEKSTLQSEIDTARARLKSRKHCLKQEAIQKYRKEWVGKQRELKVKMNGTFSNVPHKAEILDAMAYILPGRVRLALAMTSDAPACEEQRWQTIYDLYDLIIRDHTVIYLPGEGPVNGKCLLERCSLRLGQVSHLILLMFHLLTYHAVYMWIKGALIPTRAFKSVWQRNSTAKKLISSIAICVSHGWWKRNKMLTAKNISNP